MARIIILADSGLSQGQFVWFVKRKEFHRFRTRLFMYVYRVQGKRNSADGAISNCLNHLRVLTFQLKQNHGLRSSQQILNGMSWLFVYFCALLIGYMKHLPLVFSSLALIGVAFLFGTRSGNKPGKPAVIKTRDSSGKEIVVSGARIAYVDIDTLEANYDYFKRKKSEFETRQKNIDAE